MTPFSSKQGIPPAAKILVIDDEADSRAGIVRMLCLKGFEVLESDNAAQAIQMARQHRPDLVISDADLGDDDGYSILKSLRKEPATATTHFILITGNSHPDGMRRGIELGADDCLQRPFTAETLFAAVEAWLHKQQVLNQWLAKIAAAVPGIIYSFRLRPDGSTCIPYASPTIEDFYGVRAKDIVEDASSVFGLIHAGDRAHVQASIAESARTMSPWQAEFRINHPRRGCFWIEGQSIPERESDGSILWHGFMSDITKRKRVEESLSTSEQMLRLVLDTIPVRVFWKNRDSVYLGSNQLFAQDAGMASPADLVGKVDSELAWRDQAERYRSDDQRFMELGEARCHYEEPQTAPDGRTITLRTSKIPLRDQKGGIMGILGIYEDITECKRAEEALRLCEAALRAAANVVVITDRRGTIVWTNPAFTHETGYTAEEALGKNPRVLKSGEHSMEFYRKLWTTITGGSVWHGEFHNRHKHGRLLIEDSTITPVKDVDGRITHFIAVKQNITARKQAEEALRASEEEFRAMFELASVGIAQADPSTGRLLRVNQKLCAITGYSQDELLRLRFPDFTHPDDRRRDWEAFQRVVRGEAAEYRLEKRYLRKDGAMAWVNVNVTLVRDAAGKPIHSMAAIEDITERKQAEERLRESERFLQATLDALSKHIAILNGAGEIIAVNAVWERFAEANSGNREACGVGANYLTVCAAATGPSSVGAAIVAEGIHEVIAGRRSEFLMEYPCHSPSEERWFTVRVSPFAADGPVRVVVTHENITARVRAEQERKNIEVQLRHAQKLESIGQLAAGIAHEINTPTQYIGDNTKFVRDSLAQLLPVLNNLRELLAAVRKSEATPELLQTTEALLAAADLDYLSTELPKAIDDSLHGVERVAKIVRAMKDFSHPGTTEKVQVDLNRAIESTLTVARNEWKYVAELVTDFDADLPPVMCLPGEFNQVILNLVVNAAHAIGDSMKDRDETKGTITVSTRRDDDWVEVRIRDTGTGIPESARGKVFDPFFTTKAVGKGTGQGLAIARSVIVDKHGGTIDFETELGKGTVFVIRLPVAASRPKVSCT